MSSFLELMDFLRDDWEMVPFSALLLVLPNLLPISYAEMVSWIVAESLAERFAKLIFHAWGPRVSQFGDLGKGKERATDALNKLTIVGHFVQIIDFIHHCKKYLRTIDYSTLVISLLLARTNISVFLTPVAVSLLWLFLKLLIVKGLQVIAERVQSFIRTARSYIGATIAGTEAGENGGSRHTQTRRDREREQDRRDQKKHRASSQGYR